MAEAHSLRAVDLGVGDGADKRHNLAVVEKETHEGDRRFLFLSTHLAQDVSRRRRHGLCRGGGRGEGHRQTDGRMDGRLEGGGAGVSSSTSFFFFFSFYLPPDRTVKLIIWNPNGFCFNLKVEQANLNTI